MAGYNRETDVLEHSVLAAYATDGRWGSGAKRPSIIVRPEGRVDGGRRVFTMPEGVGLHDQAGAFAWSGRVLRTVEGQYGVPGWVTCSRTGMLCHVPDDWKHGVKRRRAVLGLCWELVHEGGRSVQSHVCGRPVYDEGQHLCRMHATAKAKRAQNLVKWQDEREARAQEYQRAAAMTDDLSTLWARVCDQRDVMTRGKIPMVRTDGCALVDHEVLMMLLRELDMEGGQ